MVPLRLAGFPQVQVSIGSGRLLAVYLFQFLGRINYRRSEAPKRGREASGIEVQPGDPIPFPFSISRLRKLLWAVRAASGKDLL